MCTWLLGKGPPAFVSVSDITGSTEFTLKCQDLSVIGGYTNMPLLLL